MEKTAKSTSFKNVDAYLQALPDPERITLESLRQTIRRAAPQAEEGISYQIPTYKYKGALVHFAAFKDHCSFFVVNKEILKLFDAELKSFTTSGTTIHFTPTHPVPASLVKRIVALRIKQNEGLKLKNKKLE